MKVCKSKVQDGSNPSCRLCHQFDESIDHLISGCPVLAKTDYIKQHDRVTSYIRWLLCQHYNIPTTNKWFEHKPDAVTKNNMGTILWDILIHTDEKIAANRPDVIIKDYENKECMFIDVAIPAD